MCHCTGTVVTAVFFIVTARYAAKLLYTYINVCVFVCVCVCVCVCVSICVSSPSSYLESEHNSQVSAPLSVSVHVFLSGLYLDCHNDMTLGSQNC